MTKHIPVLLHETIRILDPQHGEVFFDGTLGGGGHAREFAKRIAPKGTMIGVDRDSERIVESESLKRECELLQVRAIVRYGSYAQAKSILHSEKIPAADIILLDLGFSSFQIDDPSRGFSFQSSGPLDMRYDTRSGMTAADIVNSFSEDAIGEIIREYGEEPAARAIAKKICAIRKQSRIYETTELAEIVASVKGGRRGKIHPATKTFQALRMYVNDELGNLKVFLKNLPEIVHPKSRVGIISFHGLEDREVKNAFRDFLKGNYVELLTKKPIVPERAEIEENPRSRSAKFRAIKFI